MDITTVADDLIVAHVGRTVERLDGLRPGATYEIMGHEVRTLDRPDGELLCRFATLNDLHFGEVECGRVDDLREGPVQRVGPDETPYPTTMNRGAVSELVELDDRCGLDAVVVKGDLSADGRAEEWSEFEDCYRASFGDRLRVVRGNHDAYRSQTAYSGDQWIELPGVAIALLDTTLPTRSTGWLSQEQLDLLETMVAESDRPVIVMGHHQQWTGSSAAPTTSERSDGYFGLHPDPSDRLDAVVARQPSILAYTAGHTHRHRVRAMACGVPTIEVGCVKDFPGTWAEYRVYETGVMQVVHRISTPEALRWSERCRYLYSDFGVDYETYAMGTLAERCFTLPLRG